MKKIILICSFCLFCSLLTSTIIEIKQDGSGDYSNIQPGIDEAVDNDTILVYPGTYFENLNYNEKSITLGSLYLTTGDDAYIRNTIIDGNHIESCVQVRSCENAVLCGFTIQNGYGSEFSPTFFLRVGGGVLTIDSIINISSCFIVNNIADIGGGIYILNTQLSIANTNIKHNRSYRRGGGIGMNENSHIIFDENNLCNIYLNYSSWGNDLLKSYTCSPLEVIVDTFTVIEPDSYYIMCSDQYGQPVYDITLNIQHGKLDPVDADLYVSPDGDNTNSGLTEDEPLASVNYALSLMQPNEFDPHTVFVSDGLYSTSSNETWFPLNMRSYTSLVGASMDNTIFDGEDESPLIVDKASELNYSIKNLSLTNGRGDGYQSPSHFVGVICTADNQGRNKWVRYENLKIYNNYADARHIASWYISAYFKNVYMFDNHGPGNMVEHLNINNDLFPRTKVEMENCYLRTGNTDGFLFFQGVNQTEQSYVKLVNIEITDVYNIDTDFSSWSSLAFLAKRDVDIINCTIADNTAIHSAGSIGLVDYGIHMNVYNSIFEDNSPASFTLSNTIEEDPAIVNMYYSLLHDGEIAINNPWDYNQFNWCEGNLDPALEAGFLNQGDYPYSLSSDSPCIDAGTLNLPEGIELPEYDLAGNPRIIGETIDMGAYEYQGTNVNEELIINNERIYMSVYPNPFQLDSRGRKSYLKFNLLKSCRVNLSIYNIKGQKVKTLMDAFASRGEYNCHWNGKDDNNKPVSSGKYICKLNIDEKTEVVRKMVVVR